MTNNTIFDHLCTYFVFWFGDPPRTLQCGNINALEADLVQGIANAHDPR
jgi:hypothetical protein